MAEHLTHTTKRGVKIFRNPKINATEWIRRLTVHGKQVYFRLGSDRKEAAKKADQLDAYLMMPEATLEEARARFDSHHEMRTRVQYPTVGDLLAIHRKYYAILELRDRTARDYRNSLCYVIRVAMAYRKGKPVESYSGVRTQRLPEEGYSLDVIKPDLLADFQAGMLAQTKGDLKAEQTAKRSANSYLARFKAIFAPEAMDLYKKHKLNLPDMTWLTTVRKFRRVDRGARYVMPAESVVMDIFKGAADLDRERFKLLLLCLHAGLRREEALYARKDWIILGTPEVLHVQTEGDFMTKNAHSRSIDLQPGVGVRLDELSNGAYILDGDAVTRAATADSLVEWLREMKLSRRLPLHELRKLFGVMVSSANGIYAAQRQLGHLSPQVTSDSYSDVVVPERIIAAWKSVPFAVA